MDGVLAALKAEYGLNLADLAALLICFSTWLAYGRIADGPHRLPDSLNTYMSQVRLAWMRAMLARDARMLDGMLLGHVIHSVSFFASTTVLLLAALMGALAAGERVQGMIENIHLVQPMAQPLFEVKLLLLVAIFVYAFFKFTWSIRQFNYTIALVGAAPMGPDALEKGDAQAKAAATVLTLAIVSFNGGLRAYYFGVAALGWFIGPWAFMVAVLAVTYILWRRQFRSAAHGAVKEFAARDSTM